MPDLSKYPARVTRAVAMELLCIRKDVTFKKVVDANPGLAHKLPGEQKSKYLLSKIAKLLEPNSTAATDRRDKDSSRCATRGEEKVSLKSKAQSPKLTEGEGRKNRTP